MTGVAQPDDRPLVTVIITLYNVAAYLRRCLDSVLGQTYSNLEILLIDNASQDESAGIAAEYGARDSRVRVLRQENRGVAFARNVGVTQARGEWLTFVDGDDAMTGDAVETLLYAARSLGVKLSAAGHFVCTEGWEPRRVKLEEMVCRDALSAQRYFLTTGRGHAFPWAKLYHRDIFDTVRYPEGKVYEDLWTLPAILDAAGGCVAVDRPVYCYYLRSTSITYTGDMGRQLQLLEAWSAYEDFIGSRYPALSGHVDNAMMEACLYLLGRICRAGRRSNGEEWRKVVGILGDKFAAGSPRGIRLKTAAALFRISPVLVGYLCHWYSLWANRT